MKKIILLIAVILAMVVSTACGKSDNAVKVGVSSGDSRIWDYIVKLAKKQDIDVELVKFNDYIQPNMALSDGEIDANSFQTISYFDEFVAEHHLKLAPVASTVIAPMALYSKKVKKLEDLPNGATIAVPNEATNFGRALLLLQEAGLIKLKSGFDGTGSLNKIESNPKHLNIKEVAATNTPRFLDDVDASVINNNFAVEAGLKLDKSLFHESATAKPYINIIAVKKGNEDNANIQKLIKIYHSKEVEKFIKDTYKGSEIPAFVSVKELQNYKDAWSK